MLAFALREPGIAGSVIDVLVRPDVSYERLVVDAVNGELFGRKIKTSSIDHLLEMKRIANRPKDQLDIATLEKIKRREDSNVRLPTTIAFTSINSSKRNDGSVKPM